MDETRPRMESEPINVREEVVMNAILEFMQADGSEEEKAIALELLRERFMAHKGERDADITSVLDTARDMGLDTTALLAKVEEKLAQQKQAAADRETAQPNEDEAGSDWMPPHRQ